MDKQLLQAAKWLGNHASHGDLDSDALMDLLEIYALVLAQLFGEDPVSRIKRRARAVNRSRRRPAKRT